MSKVLRMLALSIMLLIYALTQIALTASSNQTATWVIGGSGAINQPTGNSRIAFRTTHWLCADPTYGIHGTDLNAMPALVQEIHASDIIIYYKENDIQDWQWQQLKDTVDFWRARNITTWIMIAKAGLEEVDGTPSSIQYIIDTFTGKIAGVFMNAIETIPPDQATQWLLAKKTQLATASMQCGYYHGDGFSPHYGNSTTDVDAVYLCSQGLIPIAWLMNDNSWKPMTFNLQRFWVDYDILTANETNGPTGQSYDEIYNQWYLGNVLGRDNLKKNTGCMKLVFMVYMKASWPNDDALKGMTAVADNWIGI